MRLPGNLDREQLRMAIALYRNEAFVVLEVSPELRVIVEAAEAYQALTGGEGEDQPLPPAAPYGFDDVGER